MNRVLLLVPLALVVLMPLPRALAQPSDIVPILEGVEPEPGGMLRAHWGYYNPSDSTMFVPVGVSNFFSPPPGFRGQPTLFQGGRQPNVFSTVWDPNSAASLTWTLLGRQATATASSPRLFGGIVYQGRLLDDGLPVQSPRDLRFTLYDAAQGGTVKAGPYTAGQVPIVDGLFTVELPFSTEFDGQRMWLAVEVSLPGAGIFSALVPRQAITPTAYAHRARVADSAASLRWADLTDVPSIVANPPWVSVTGGIRYAGGNVGIGTAGPTAALHVSGGPTADHLLVESSNSSGTWVNISNSDTGGRRWNLIATGSANVEGAGRLLLRDQTALATRVVIDAAGQVGIGTATPNRPLTIVGATPSAEWIQFRSADGQNKWHINNLGNGLNIAETNASDARVFVAAGGNVGIGTSSPAQKLHVSGSIQASCGVLTCSDARFKDHVETLAGALDTVTELRPVVFHWRQSEFPERNFAGGPQFGFIAQDTQRVLPEVVSVGSDGYLSVNYASLTPVLTRAIQELRAEHDQQIARLQAENAELRARLDRLEQRLTATAHEIERR